MIADPVLPVAPTPIHLILGSGGARGLAHIGVIKVLHERAYRIESITGCSMGALVGALYATRHLEAYEEWVCQLTRRDVLRFLDLSLLGRAGMVKGDRLMEQLSSWLAGVDMEELRLPLTVVAADIVARKEVWITRGDLLEAVRASIAVPGVFTPLLKSGRILVDGGILNPLPVPPARMDNSALNLAVSVSGRDMTDPLGEHERRSQPVSGLAHAAGDGAVDAPTSNEDSSRHQRIEGFLDSLQHFFGRDRVSVEESAIAASRSGRPGEKEAARPALTDVMLGMFATMQDIIARHQLAGNPPDILIDIPRNICQSHEFYRAREVIDAGEYWARRALDEQRIRDERGLRGPGS
ncbi:MAG: patatin-like phospholipase family protein [Halieaceae bacterium]|nr:patatin-like phospholipase family protein [Halieaceae bacterium]